MALFFQTESPTEEAGSSGSGSGSGSGNAESAGDKLRPGALDKMVALVAGLVERSRDASRHLALDEPDAKALLHAKVRSCFLGLPGSSDSGQPPVVYDRWRTFGRFNFYNFIEKLAALPA